MSTDKRKNTAKESKRNKSVQDLPSKSTKQQDAGQVKGGSIKFTDIVITKTYDKSSP